MTKITINPGPNLYDHKDYKIYFQKKGRSTTEEFSLDKSFIWMHHLEKDDRIAITYKGIPQSLSNDENSGDPPRTFDFPDDKDITLYIFAPSAKDFPGGLTDTTVQNDVGVNLKSFHLKEPLEIKLTPSTGSPTRDQAFWEVINNHKLDFKHYRNFIDDILSCDLTKEQYHTSANSAATVNKELFDYHHHERRADSKRLPFNRTEAYSLLKYATERYVEHIYNLANYIDDGDGKEKFNLDDYLGKDKVIPYYDLIESRIREYFKKDHDGHNGFLEAHADTTLIELVWSYWHEEGMVSQTMIALARRFQNIKNGYKDPLLNFALDPLRPLNNILWGYIQDAQHRLTATRRNYEYTSEYDLCVMSAIKPGFNPADRRSKFLQSFHRLIYEATEYFVQSDNTTIRPDGFKLLNALRDTHRILAEGAHNQFGDLPTVARIEMLIEQWILSRSEVREFLGGRIMVPYEEPWMDRVDSMKALQGWDNTSISFYRDLAVYGEKIILGVRYGNWTNITRRDHATNWADAFRDAIQRYIHSYYTVTGIDLSAPNVSTNSEEKYTLPGIHIKNKQNQFLRRS